MNIKEYVRLSVRILNIIFWMILAYLAGDVGMGFYYLGFIIFEVLVILFGSGLKQSVARMVAVRRSKGLHYNSKLVFRYGILYSLVFGVGIGFIIWNLSGNIYSKGVGYIIPESVFGVLGAYYAIHLVRGVLQGYYQGRGNTLICIVAELSQSIVQVILCPILVIHMYKHGMKISGLLKNSLYANIGGAIGAVYAQCIAGILCILILVIGDRIAGTVDRNEYNSVKGVDNAKNITISFIKMGLVYIGEHIFPVIKIAAIILIYVRSAYSKGADVKTVFESVGVFADKFIIVIGLFMALFIEFIDRECKKIRSDAMHDEHKNVRTRATYLLRNSILILLPISMILIVLAKPITGIFFGGRISLGVTMLRNGGIVLFLCGLCYMCKSVFSSVKVGRYSIIGGVCGFAATLIGAGALSGMGAQAESMAIAFVIGYLIETAVMLIIYYRMMEFDAVDMGIRTGKICIGVGVLTGLIAIMDHFIILNIIFLPVTIVIAYGAYIITLAVIKGITVRDINSLKGTLIYYPLVFVGNLFVNR